jgi:hypothetical protein
MSSRYAPLEGYEIAGCAAFDRNLVCLWGQQWPDNDPLEPRPTSVFFHYADEPPGDRWAHSGIANATGIHGCAGLVPERQWVFVLDDGEVYVVGAGADDFEQKIVPDGRAFFSNVRAIGSGEVLAVGGLRKVFQRVHRDKWQRAGEGMELPAGGAARDPMGFSDIDGFDIGELYAAGEGGDFWTCRQSRWSRVDLGTNAALTHVCCAGDGFVYVTTGRREIYRGRHDQWALIQQDQTQQVFESIVDFQGRVIVSTESALYEIVKDRFLPAAFPGMPPMKMKAHLAAAPDVLVVAGKDEACLFDGKAWERIL